MAKKTKRRSNLAPQSDVLNQIESERTIVDFDTAEYTAEHLANNLRYEDDLDESRDLYVPKYQRPLVWSNEQKSKFIESMIIGIPIPFLFCAQMPNGDLEIVDGSQRLRTIKEFLSDGFSLKGMDKLTALNGYIYSNMPVSEQKKFRNRSLRMIILSEKAGLPVRFDIFNRINSFGKRLTDSQIRKGAFPGPFYRLVEECASHPDFVRLCPMPRKTDATGDREELVLRFFVYSHAYENFSHDVARFLNEFIVEEHKNPKLDLQNERQQFFKVVRFVETYFPFGFFRVPNSSEVPRVRFEAIAIGTRLALEQDENLVPQHFDWLYSKEFQSHVRSDASNSGPRLRGRIEYVMEKLLEGRENVGS